MSKLPTMTSEELHALRKSIGLTQEQAAEKFGVDIRSYRRWENGERGIPGPAVVLARILRKFPAL